MSSHNRKSNKENAQRSAAMMARLDAAKLVNVGIKLDLGYMFVQPEADPVNGSVRSHIYIYIYIYIYCELD
jgi:hypothetical protein